MTLVAHVLGVPVEELALTATGAGAALVFARAWVSSRLRAIRDGRA